MTKVRLALLGMLAVFAVSIVASSTASAALQEYWDCQNVGTGGHWKNAHCTEAQSNGAWDTKGLTGTETKVVEGTSGESLLRGTVLKMEVVIRCLKDRFTGKLESGGASSGEIEFLECTVESPKGTLRPNCRVEPIKFKFKDQLIHNAKGEIEDEFKPTGAEETFVEITLANKSVTETCIIANTYKVKGSQVCELPNASQSLVTHQIVCTPAGSKLTLGTEKAEFTSNEHVNVLGGPQWGAS